MTDPTGATPPRDDDPNSTGQQPPAGQPTGEPWGQQPAGEPDGQQPPAAPTYGAPGQQPPAAPAYGAPTGQPYGAPTGEPYGQQPPAGQPYGAPTGEPYGQQPPTGQPYGAPTGQPYGQQPPTGQPYGAPAGYGQPSPTAAISEGFTWSWNKFTQNAGPLIGGLAVYGAGLVVLSIIFFTITIGAATAAADPYSSYGAGAAGVSLISTLLFVALVMLFAVFVQAGLIRAVTEVMRTGRTTFATFFKFEQFGTVLLAALLVGIGNAVGSMLLYIGGIVFGFFAQFTLFYVIDKGLGAIDAIKASFQLAARNFAPAALLYLVALVASAVGGALCGIGALVTTPLAMLLTGFVFRRLHGEGVAA